MKKKRCAYAGCTNNHTIPKDVDGLVTHLCIEHYDLVNSGLSH